MKYITIFEQKTRKINSFTVGKVGEYRRLSVFCMGSRATVAPPNLIYVTNHDHMNHPINWFLGKIRMWQHSVEIVEILSHTFIAKISWKQRVYQIKKLLNSWFDEKKFSEREFPVFPHCGSTVFGNCRNSLSHSFCKNFVKAMVLLKKLLTK